jgi:hypothetical protein
VKRLLIIGGVVLGLVLLGAIVTALIYISLYGEWANVRDGFLIMLALMVLAAMGAMMFSLYVLTTLVLALRSEIMPILESLKDTTATVRDTTKLASDFAIAPGVRTASVLIGAQQMASVLLGRGKAYKRAQRREQRRQELLARGELDGRS